MRLYLRCVDQVVYFFKRPRLEAQLTRGKLGGRRHNFNVLVANDGLDRAVRTVVEQLLQLLCGSFLRRLLFLSLAPEELVLTQIPQDLFRVSQVQRRGLRTVALRILLQRRCVLKFLVRNLLARLRPMQSLRRVVGAARRNWIDGFVRSCRLLLAQHLSLHLRILCLDRTLTRVAR